MLLGVRASENCSLVNHGDVVLFTQPVGRLAHSLHSLPCDVYALSAATGKTLLSETKSRTTETLHVLKGRDKTVENKLFYPPKPKKPTGKTSQKSSFKSSR